MNHEKTNEIMIRYVYMLQIDNRGKKSKFYGQKKILYTGQTNNIIRRLKEHISGVNSKFLNNNFRDAQKKPVFIEYVYGTEYESIQREYQIKSMSTIQKRKLIESEENILIGYKPLKHLIIKKFNQPEEQIILCFNKEEEVI